MFETLDSIDWAAIKEHVYGKPHEIPNNIRQLVSPDPQERENALGFLFGVQQDYGDIYESTQHIIPFVLEVLADSSQPGHSEILDYFEAITTSKVYTGGRKDYSIREVRNYLGAYDALQQGISIYIKLLDDFKVEIRSNAAAMLGGLSDSATSILPILAEFFTREPEEKVQIAIIEAMARLLSEQDSTGTKLRQYYAPFFLDVLNNTTSPQLRFVAAKSAILASVSLGFAARLEKNEVTPAIADALIEAYWLVPNGRLKALHQQRIIQLLAMLPGITSLLELLNHSTTTPDEAHTIVRGLLSRNVAPSQLKGYWNYTPDYRYKNEKKYYSNFNISKHWMTIKGAAISSNILQIIADTDKFWAMPTNLLSVMFSLPDDREQFRAFVNQWEQSTGI